MSCTMDMMHCEEWAIASGWGGIFFGIELLALT